MTTSIRTVTPSAMRVNGPRAWTSLMTAIVDGGESARRTAPPKIAVAIRAEGSQSAVNGKKAVSRYTDTLTSVNVATRMPPVLSRICRIRGISSLR